MDIDVRIYENIGKLYCEVSSGADDEVGAVSVLLLRFPLEKRPLMELKGRFDGISTSASVYKEVKETAQAHSDEAYAPFLEVER